MGNLTDILTSNLINAASLDPKVKIEAAMVSVRPREFEDGTTKPVAQGLVLNQTRLKAGIAAWGPNPDNWVGKTVIISRGTTMYAGKETPCVVMEPVVANRLGAARSARPSITSGRGASLRSVEAASPIDRYDGPEGESDGTEDIPF